MPAASNPERKTMQVALARLLLLERGPRLSTRRGRPSIPFPFTPDMTPSSGPIICRLERLTCHFHFGLRVADDMLARRKKQLASCMARQDLTISVLLNLVLLLRVLSSVQN